MIRRFAFGPSIGILAAMAATQACSGPADDPTGNVQEPVEAWASVPADAVPDKSPQVYIVQLDGSPAVTYTGDKPGYKATKPAKGKKIDSKNADVVKYVHYLESKHDALTAAHGASKIYSYTYSFNGFAAEMTPAQAAALKNTAGVVDVQVDVLKHPTTDNTPDFLGIRAPGGLWDQLGGPENAGEDVIIGVIDTGVWPEHPSFSDQPDLADVGGRGNKKYAVYGPPENWNGTCQSGERWSQDDCNNKLIGSRYFLEGFGHFGVVKGDYKSGRDASGHGTHTASTAGGNANVPASIGELDLGYVSGMAPRARIASYKVCWNDEGCAVSDLTAAIDMAVADGVDVINYSIGGGPALLTADEISFLFAEDAGVFVAVSAGNEGPDPGTVGSPAVVPWVVSVGASTQDRTFDGIVTLGDGTVAKGVSLTGGVHPAAPLVDAADATSDGDDLCQYGTLNPDVVAGNIVLCKRGVYARVEKSAAVAAAGGVGMILYNVDDADSLVTDNHYVPSVHMNLTNGMMVKSYLGAAGPMATASLTTGIKGTQDAPHMAAFSSRGPNVTAFDIIKPDVTAPGVNVLAGATPTPLFGAPGEMFQAISGTSMSSPHVAGIGALLKARFPGLTPAMYKSALMTTGSQAVMKQDGVTAADPFDMGGGHVVPTAAADPGLVYHTDIIDNLRWLCGASPQSVSPDFCASLGGAIDSSDLNLASIGIADLAGQQIVTRTVWNVTTPGEWTVAVDMPEGITATVTPSVMTFTTFGEPQSYQVEFTVGENATYDVAQFGSITWSDHNGHVVRSPVALTPVAMAAPAEVASSGMEGHLDFDVTFGFATPDFAARPFGLAPANTQPGNVVDDPANDINVALATGVGITMHPVVVSPDTIATRFSLFDGYIDGMDDLDLYVFGPDSAGFPFQGGSGSGTSEEQVDLFYPQPGMYLAVVHGWQTDGPDSNYTLFDFQLQQVDDGNMTVFGPTAATLGATETIGVDWFGLDAGTKYMGGIGYFDSNVFLNDGTIVRIDTD